VQSKSQPHTGIVQKGDFMSFLKGIGLLVCLLALGSLAMARENNLGIHQVSHVTFSEPTRVGSALLPAGDYVVRHTMEGQEHVMIFQPAKGKTPEVKVKCTLVALPQRANQSRTVCVLNAANERVLRELVVRGDTAKHVFE
jgi:hypothetical protein